MPKKGYKQSIEHRTKLSVRMKNEHLVGSTSGFKNGHKPYNTVEGNIRSGLAHTGPNSYLWEGDKAKYRTIHTWVTKWKGKPEYCEFCNKTKTTPKSIHWANKSHNYKRDLTDWLSLCVSCHKRYDKAAKS